MSLARAHAFSGSRCLRAETKVTMKVATKRRFARQARWYYSELVEKLVTIK
jgi:hypothetical protein